MRLNQCAVLLAVIACVALLVPAAVAGDGPPTYTNAQVVAVDPTGRTLVIRNAKGVEEKVELDDNLAGFGDIKAGDRVILSLRAGPGWPRVSSIFKSRAVPAPRAATSPLPRTGEDSPSLDARDAFGAQVARLASQADQVDRVWSHFQSACDFRAGSPHEGERGWFVVWEGSIQADMSASSCRDLFNEIIDLGEPIKAAMSEAEDVARRSVSPGDIREIRRRYRMDWDGRAPPKQF